MGNGTAIGRVRGLGAARGGTHHWLVQRFTAIGNLIAVGWLVFSLATMPDVSYLSVRDWLSHPVPAAMMGLLIITAVWHARLGMQVMMEDYVHEHGMKFAALAALNLAAFGSAAFGLVCVVRLALGGA